MNCHISKNFIEGFYQILISADSSGRHHFLGRRRRSIRDFQSRRILERIVQDDGVSNSDILMF